MEYFWKDTQEIGCLGNRNERDLNLLYNPFGPLEFYNMYMCYLHKKKTFNAKKSSKCQVGGKREDFPVQTANCAQMFICSVFQGHVKKMLKEQKWYKPTTVKRIGEKLLASEIFLNISGRSTSEWGILKLGKGNHSQQPMRAKSGHSWWRKPSQKSLGRRQPAPKTGSHQHWKLDPEIQCRPPSKPFP